MPCLAANLFQHRPLFANNNPFVGISLTNNRGINVNQISRFSFLHLVDCYSNAMRNLITEIAQCFLTDQF